MANRQPECANHSVITQRVSLYTQLTQVVLSSHNILDRTMTRIYTVEEDSVPLTSPSKNAPPIEAAYTTAHFLTARRPARKPNTILMMQPRLGPPIKLCYTIVQI
jgi:hypothetical protein